MAPFFEEGQARDTNASEFHLESSKSKPHTNGTQNGEYTNGINDEPYNVKLNPDIDPALEEIQVPFEAKTNGSNHHRAQTFRPHSSLPGGPQAKSQAKVRTYTDDPDRQQFPRISKPVELMREAYDVVVIGSGYGGGVAASRMARGRQSVCLLERGKEKWREYCQSQTKDSYTDYYYSRGVPK